MCSAQRVEHFLFIAVLCRKSAPDYCRVFPMYAVCISNGRWPKEENAMKIKKTVSDKVIIANCKNARKSTGPRSTVQSRC